MKDVVKKQKKIKLTIVASAVFSLDELFEITDWKDAICEIGEIKEETVEIVEE